MLIWAVMITPTVLASVGVLVAQTPVEWVNVGGGATVIGVLVYLFVALERRGHRIEQRVDTAAAAQVQAAVQERDRAWQELDAERQDCEERLAVVTQECHDSHSKLADRVATLEKWIERHILGPGGSIRD